MLNREIMRDLAPDVFRRDIARVCARDIGDRQQLIWLDDAPDIRDGLRPPHPINKVRRYFLFGGVMPRCGERALRRAVTQVRIGKLERRDLLTWTLAQGEEDEWATIGVRHCRPNDLRIARVV